ncbi:MRM3 methyltransferase, partial [Nothoprocta ornata]|nr:MRM3 methyltransferase [Nothoprocta ornata]
RVVTMARSRKLREQHGAVLLEGPRLIRDALQAGAAPRTLFFSTVEQLKALPEDRLKGANLVKVKFEDIKSWSDVVTPQGLLGIFSKPDYTKMAYPADQLSNSLPLVLICDNIRDPGNLGTILRSAAGAGCKKVLLTKGCVDAWEPKVLRAGMGAHFRVPIIANLDWESLPEKLPAGVRVCVADNRDAGVRTELEPTAESTPGTLESHPGACPGAGEARAAAGDAGMALVAQQYHESWAWPPVAVVVGGETQGLSAGALRLAAGTGGRRLVIPVAPGVDSLNSAVAAAILLFEGKRQLCGSRQRDDERQELPAPG